MASLQQKTVNGYKYWYIVEGRRINGKPTPVVLQYLGTADNLLKRLNQRNKSMQLKSYSHGDIAALLSIAHKLDMPSIINKHIHSSRDYFSEKPIRNNLTAGATFLLGAIGRTCMLTSKRGWYNWAKTTSLEYLLRVNLSKIDSQHFWDLMDALPEKSIPKVEEDLLKKVMNVFDIKSDTLFFDTTNFYTYIATTNTHCTIAQRGKNKQKRSDLRQVGMALVVTREDLIPLFHHSYRGNMNDTVVFKTVIGSIKQRIINLGLDINNHTFVFDRGNNSIANLEIVKKLELFYVGALTPCHHIELTVTALKNLKAIKVDRDEINSYRTKTKIWNEERTIITFISEKLKSGQIRGIYQMVEKKMRELHELQEKLSNPKSKKRSRKQITEQINNILKTERANRLICWDLQWESKGRYRLIYAMNQKEIDKLEENFGVRILMTNRHDWSTKDIVKAFYGQSNVEKAFKELKNPFHMSVKPQYHWTDQKIKVHNLICVIGFLLSTLTWWEVRRKTDYKGCMNTLFNTLKNIKLGSVLEKNEKNGRLRADYKLEMMDVDEQKLFDCMELMDFHTNTNRQKFKCFSIYN
jgi:transposase